VCSIQLNPGLQGKGAEPAQAYHFWVRVDPKPNHNDYYGDYGKKINALAKDIHQIH
jgi:hypothetical protein